MSRDIVLQIDQLTKTYGDFTEKPSVPTRRTSTNGRAFWRQGASND